MRHSTEKWRRRVLEACQTVAQGTSSTSSGAAHAVQLMMQDPDARACLLDDALALAGPGGPHYRDTEQYQRVQAAVDVLRGYAGVRL